MKQIKANIIQQILNNQGYWTYQQQDDEDEGDDNWEIVIYGIEGD